MTTIDRTLSIDAVAAIVSEALTKAGLQAVLSGGSVVSIYSNNEYESYDLDFVTPESLDDLEKVMGELGFERKSSRHFVHPDCDYFVEFPPSPLMLGDETVQDWTILESGEGSVQILTPTQCVMDRLAAFYHWNDRQCLDQAVMVAKRQPVDLGKVETWSTSENRLDGYREFLSRLGKL